MTAFEQEVLTKLAVNQKLIMALYVQLLTTETILMATLAEVQAKADAALAQITAETSVVNAVKVVVDNFNVQMADLKAQIAALIAAGGTDAAALQVLSDTVDGIMAADTSNAAVVAAAVAAGTPAEPPTP